MLRAGHGNGAGRPHIELPPVTELSEGVPAELQPPRADTPRDARGRFVPGNPLASRGGAARKNATKLAERLGLDSLGDPEFKPYRDAAEQFKRMHVARLAQLVGGGECGPGPASMVASAALQLAASRWAFDRGQMELGSRLANDSRQNLLAAHELCAREAKARPQKNPSLALEEALRDDE